MADFRLKKVASLLQSEISSLIFSDALKDPRIDHSLAITLVEPSKDLSYAKVFVSSFLSEEHLKDSVKGLNQASGFIFTQLSKKIKLRVFPRLTFYEDLSIQESIKINQTIKEILSDEKP